MRIRTGVALLLGIAILTTDAWSLNIEDDLSVEFERLGKKHAGNPTMIATVDRLERDWHNYQQSLCQLERLSTAGGQLNKRMPPASERAHAECMARTASEMRGILAKY